MIFISMKYDIKKISEVCSNTNSMAEAARELAINYKTLKKYTETLGLFNPNPSGKGINKKGNGTKIPLNEILEGLHPNYQTNKLRIRLIKEGFKPDECEVCGIDKWLGNKISLELDHIDGDKHNHKYNNLRIVCPNCHSQTSTYRGKNIGANRQK
jgi:Zn finger protein HypA/HybF involved in hydrogenase expression